MKKNIVNIILGIILILFGVIFIFAPASSFSTIILFVGILIILFGVIKLISTLKVPGVFGYSIYSAVISILFGIILIAFKESTVKLIVNLIGIWLLISGISGLILLIKSNAKGSILVRPISKIIIGFVCLMLPIIPVTITGIFIGVILIIAGASMLTTEDEDEVVYKVKVKK